MLYVTRRVHDSRKTVTDGLEHHNQFDRNRPTDKQTNKQTDRQTERQAIKQTE